MTTPLLDSNGKLNGESVRYVAIGDSFTEGVGDVDRRRPNSLRGWADRVAEGIGAVDPQAQYANLAIRGACSVPSWMNSCLEPWTSAPTLSPSTVAAMTSCDPTWILTSS